MGYDKLMSGKFSNPDTLEPTYLVNNQVNNAKKQKGIKRDYMEKSLILLKPDSIQRSLVGTINSKIEQKGIKIVDKIIKLF